MGDPQKAEEEDTHQRVMLEDNIKPVSPMSRVGPHTIVLTFLPSRQ